MPPPNVFDPTQQQQPPSVFDTTAPPAPMLQPSAAVNVPSVFAPAPPTPSVFSPLQQNEDVKQQRLQKLQYQDANPWGSADNHPGVFGKIAHGLSLAGNIAGDIFAPAVMANIPGTDAHRQVEEQGLNRDIQGLEHEKVANQAQQAEADRTQQQTQFAAEQEPGKLEGQAADTAHTKAETEKLGEDPEPNWQHIETDQGIFAHNPKTNEIIPLTYQGKPLLPAQKQKELSATADLQNQIEAASQAGNQPLVKKLQQQLKDLNPMGEQRINIDLSKMAQGADNKANAADAKTKAEAYKAFAPALDSAERFNVMTQNGEDSLKGNQQAMLSLLTNHLGMTAGLQKGMRINQQMINEAAQSQPWLAHIGSKFDQNGYLSGLTLGKEQIHQMVGLARDRYSQDVGKARSQAKYMGATDDGPERAPSRATINYYTHLAAGDPSKAKQLAAQDGWTIK